MKNTLKITKLALAAAVAFGMASAHADNYPNAPIQLIVNYTAGGTTDAFARKLAQHLPKHLPNNPKVIVINKPGGAGTIGLTSLARAKPDGYTIGLTTSSPLVVQPLYSNVPFSATDFEPVAKLMEIPAAFNVHKDSDIYTVDQLVTYAKANPGKFTYASTGGNGSGTHLVGDALGKALGINIRHIPFEGTAQMDTALTSKQIMGTMQMPTVHRGGDARPLVFLTSMKPQTDDYKDTPTSEELNIPVVADFFTAILAPKGTPADKIKILEEAFRKASEEPDLQKWAEGIQIPVVYSSSESLKEIIASETEFNRTMLKEVGLIK